MVRSMIALACAAPLTISSGGLVGASESSSRLATSANTTRVELSVIVEGRVTDARGGAVFDYHADRAKVERWGEMRLSIGRMSYTRSLICGKWYWEEGRYERDGVPTLDLLTLDAEGPSPGELLEYLRRESAATKSFGKELVDGLSTTHYRFDLPNEPSHLWRWDAWVSADNRVRRIEEFDINRRGEQVVTRFDYFDLGAQVDIESPPVLEVVTYERALELRTCKSG